MRVETFKTPVGSLVDLMVLLHQTRRLILVALYLFWIAGSAAAQPAPPPALLADDVSYDADQDALIATGNVEIYFEGTILRARKITYFNESGRVSAEGPITLSSPDAETIIADFASLDRTLQSGLVQGARLVLAENFQFASQQVVRIDSRFSVLNKTVASSCQVCARNPTPLWLIRADRIVRDNETKLIHFEDVRFELYGVTIAALPYFRIPDPAISRATGILRPQIRSADTFGTGIEIPYFIVIDDHSDVTITPFLTTKGTSIIEGEYRRRFKDGDLSFNGAFATDDRNTQGGMRGFIFSDGSFNIPRGYHLNFSLRRSGDKTFLNEFGFSETDRLTSRATLSRQRNKEFISYSATGFQSLRATENDNNIPYVLPEISYERYWDNIKIGGRATAEATAVGLTRKLGRDVYKLGGRVSWERTMNLAFGLQGQTLAGLDGWLYATKDDPNFSSSPEGYLAPTVAADLRWPLVRRTERATQVLEPVAQIVYREASGDLTVLPNEDSVQVEFDASNLFALDRSPGTDLIEEGLRFNLGVNYTHLSDEGWKFGLTLGRVLRTRNLSQFAAGTGLNSKSSNFVAAANLDFPPYFNLSNQTLFDEDLAFSRNDIQASVNLGAIDVNANYVFLLPDVTASSLQKRQEVAFDASYQINRNWSVGATYRRNLATGNDVERHVKISYGNECISTDFSVSRRLTNSNNIPPSTEFGLSVSLAGIGGGGGARPARECRPR